MKKHTNLIRLIAITAVLAALGFFSYKKLQQKLNSDNAQVVIQTVSKTTQPPVYHSVASIKQTAASSYIKSNSQVSGGCIETNGQCTAGSTPCCRHGVTCYNGYCTES